jgi:hypothetical protein
MQHINFPRPSHRIRTKDRGVRHQAFHDVTHATYLLKLAIELALSLRKRYRLAVLVKRHIVDLTWRNQHALRTIHTDPTWLRRSYRLARRQKKQRDAH